MSAASVSQEEARAQAVAVLEASERPVWGAKISVPANGFVQFTPGSVFVELVMEIPL